MKGLRVLLIVALAAGIGCDPTPIYRPTRGGYFGSSISDKKTWALSGTLDKPAAAADGNLATAARSGSRYAGAELVIDLKTNCIFQTVILDHGAAADGHARLVGVATSIDGKNWTDRYSGPGTRRVTILSMPEVVLARYLRIQALAPAQAPWAIAEVYLQ